jgi:hypothetical protein
MWPSRDKSNFAYFLLTHFSESLFKKLRLWDPDISNTMTEFFEFKLNTKMFSVD